MNIIKNILTMIFFMCAFLTNAQSENKNEDKEKPEENSSEEIVTKIIRIKGPNGEEKVIKQQQVITKKSELKFDPEDEDKTNRTARYTPEKVSIKNMGTTSNEKLYSSIPDGSGFIIILIDETGEKTSRAKPISNGYYLVNNGLKDNCLGHFDENKNLILESYDSKNDTIATLTYKLK